MALRVVKEATSIDLATRKGMIVFEGDTFDEVNSGEPVRLALDEANRGGLSAAGISSRGTPYSVQADGSPITDPGKGMPHGAKFRVDIKVLATT